MGVHDFMRVHIVLDSFYYEHTLHIYIKYIVMNFLKLKNMDWFVVCAYIYAFLCMNFIWNILYGLHI